MRRLLVVVLLAGCLSGCGDPGQAYCERLSADQTAFSEMINADDPGAALLAHLPMLQELAGQAPGDLSAQWQTFVNAVVGLRDALKAAGADPSEFRNNTVPANITGQARANIVGAATRLGSTDVLSSVSDIEQQARDVCKINFGM